jgi:hypothetical protein
MIWWLSRITYQRSPRCSTLLLRKQIRVVISKLSEIEYVEIDIDERYVSNILSKL